MDLDAYFERIGLRSSAGVSAETLAELHARHAFCIPFENLDVYRGIPISLNPDDLFKKIVTEKRGGYCFEMNGLFSSVLKTLGFHVTDVLARVKRYVDASDGDSLEGDTPAGDGFGPKTHQALIVDLNGVRWLADVGFGSDGLPAPILLDEAGEQQVYGRSYRVTRSKGRGFFLEHKTAAGFETMYTFTDEPCIAADFEVANHYTSTHPDSWFTQMRFCTIATPTGRITLTDNHLKITSEGEQIETPIHNEAAFEEALAQYFGMRL